MPSQVILRRPRRARWPLFVTFSAALAGLALLGALAAWWAYETNDWVRENVEERWALLRDTFAPVPNVPTAVPAAAVSTLPAPTALSSATLPPTSTPPATASAGPTLSPTPLPPSPTPGPESVILTGVKHEFQLFNNCGPASLSSNLSYWGWTGTQKDIASLVKPNQYDRNVNPRELYEYLLTVGYDAYIRVNGDVDSLKRFIAAGYPVLVEKGYYCEKGERCSGWFGHYSVFNGYDDARGVFITQDTFRGPDLKISYEEVEENWRAFNYVYLVVFPDGAENDAEVLALLGEAGDLNQNYRAALDRARQETLSLTGEAAAFAWYNVGTNLVYFNDYAGAAQAYDQARAIGLPYRMLWYQFGPYHAYYYTARYRDVVDLASFAIDASIGEPGLEEAYYWRGQAQEMLGQRDAAIDDYRTALVRHPNYQPALDALARLGVSP